MEDETTDQPATQSEETEEGALRSHYDVDMLVRVRDLLNEMP